MKKFQQERIRNICSKLYLDDYDRFTATLQLAVDFKVPGYINKAFSQVGALIEFKLAEDDSYNLIEDEEVKSRINKFVDLYTKLRQGVKLDRVEISAAVGKGDVSGVEALYSKGFTDSIAEQILNKVTPGLYRLFNDKLDIDDFRRFIYSKIVSNENSNWQQKINSVFGNSQYDDKTADNFLQDMILRVYEGKSLGVSQEEVKDYQEFLKKSHTLDFVDNRVQKYAEKMLHNYEQIVGTGKITRNQLNDFKTKNKGILNIHFGSLVNFLGDEHVRFNFVSPVIEKLKKFIETHPQVSSETSVLKYVEEKNIIKNTPKITEHKVYDYIASKENKTPLKLSKPIVSAKQVSSYKSNSIMDEYMECYMANMVEQGLLPSGVFDEEYIAKHKKAFIYQLAHNMDKFGEAAVIDELRKIIDANSKER